MALETPYLRKRIILEGCNTEWAQVRYLPALLESAWKGYVELWAIGVEPEVHLNASATSDLWHVMERSKSVHYINKTDNLTSNPSDVAHVFVVTPDQYHCSVASYWLDRIVPSGTIFIEKPLDVYVPSALALKQKIEKGQKQNTVFAFDHYLARAWPFLREKREYLQQIGGIETIDFSILESSDIPPHREKSLDKGILFDLFCHIIAVTCAIVEEDSILSKSSIQQIKLDKVKGAQYAGCPIRGETSALLDYSIGDVSVRSIMGKYVASDSKVMNICGSQGQIRLDFLRDEFEVFDFQGNRKERRGLNPRHVETFIEKAIREPDVTLSDGVLSLEVALEILRILDQTNRQIKGIPPYEPLTPINQIFEELEHTRWNPM